MKFWLPLLLTLLMLPVLAGKPVASVKVTAHQYYDEYERKWYLVESICIERLSDPVECLEQNCGGVEMADLTLNELELNSEYRVRVRWEGGSSMEETYTVYEPGQINLWIDLPD